MKYGLLLTLFILTIASPSVAEETLLTGQIAHGGYGGPVIKFTQLNGEFAVLGGLQGGWIIDHTFVLGAAAIGLATDHHPQSVPAGLPYTRDELRTDYGYFGIMLSYVGMSDRVLHPTFDILIGGGDLQGSNHDMDWSMEDNASENRYWHQDKFFVLEPTVNGELNIIDFMRLDLGLGYRLVSGVEGWGFSNSDVGGISGSATLKFGKF